jgi:hypothetical protein
MSINGRGRAMKYADKVTMRYEGDKNSPETLICVFEWRGKEWELPYSSISTIAELYSVPEAVREHILLWADMRANPD